MNAKLVINTAFCLNRFDPKYRLAQEFLDNEVIKDSDRFVPFRHGDLVKSAPRGTIIGSGQIEYAVPYARRMYYGVNYNFSKHKHPQACAQWFEAAKGVHGEQWISSVNKIIRGE